MIGEKGDVDCTSLNGENGGVAAVPDEGSEERESCAPTRDWPLELVEWDLGAVLPGEGWLRVWRSGGIRGEPAVRVSRLRIGE